MDLDMSAEQPQAIKKRPRWLSFLIIMTCTGIVIDLVIVAAAAIGSGFSILLRSVPIIDTMLIEDSAGGWLYLFVRIIVLAALSAAAFNMWKMKRLGYWLYLGSQALLLLIPFIFLLKLGTGYLLVRLLLNTIFALLFVMLYSIQLKNMN
jgi:hypothetical protein